MLQKLREQTKNTAFKVLVGVIVFVLAIFGFGAFNLFLSTDPEVASVYGNGITQNMLTAQFERLKRQLAGQLGEQFDSSLINQGRLQNRALEQLISSALLNHAVNDLGLGVSSAQISKNVRANPNFQIDGKFSEAQYRQMVRFLGYSPQAFLDQTGQSFTIQQLNNAITSTGILADWQLRQGARLINQQRDLAYLTFSTGHFSDQIAVDDEDVQLRYDENQLDYMTERNADVDYVELSWDALIAEVEVTDDQVRKTYEVDRDESPSSERRRSAHILVQVTEERGEEQAEALLEDLKVRVAAGESFGELAEEFSEDPGSASSGGELGTVAKGVFDPEFERVLWSLSEGEISDPVRTEFGYHLIRLDTIEADEYPAFEILRPEIEMRLKQEQSRELFIERIREMDNLAFEQSDSLAGIAQALGLEIKETNGVVLGAGDGVFNDPLVREAVFSKEVFQDGFNSAAIEYQDQRAVVVRVTANHAPVIIPIADVAEDIKAQIVSERARVLASDGHSDALARLKAGDGVSIVADDYGLEWQTIALARRNEQTAPREVVQSAFSLPRPVDGGKSIGEAASPGGDKFIVTVTRINDGDMSSMSDAEIQSIKRELANRSSQMDYSALFDTLEDQASIRRVN